MYGDGAFIAPLMTHNEKTTTKSEGSSATISKKSNVDPSKENLKQIEKNQRGFLWAGRAAAWRALPRQLASCV